MWLPGIALSGAVVNVWAVIFCEVISGSSGVWDYVNLVLILFLCWAASCVEVELYCGDEAAV